MKFKVAVLAVTIAALCGCGSAALPPAASLLSPAATSQAPVSTGQTTYICSGSSQATLLQWTDDNGDLSGTYTYSYLTGTAPQEQVSSSNGNLSGTLNGTAITLDIGFQQPMYGSLSGGTLTLNVPQSDGSYQPGTCTSGTLSAWNSVVSGFDTQASGDNSNEVQASASASQASANAAAEQQAQTDMGTLQGLSLSSDLSKLSSDLTQTSNDLAAEKTAAAAGPNADGGDCYNLEENVDYDAQENVEYDAQEDLGYDLQENLVPDISSGRQDISAFQSDLSNLQGIGLSAPAGAQAAITAAENTISNAVSMANADISQENGFVSQAWSVANSIATGSCAGDGPGAAPSPIQDIS